MVAVSNGMWELPLTGPFIVETGQVFRASDPRLRGHEDMFGPLVLYVDDDGPPAEATVRVCGRGGGHGLVHGKSIGKTRIWLTRAVPQGAVSEPFIVR